MCYIDSFINIKRTSGKGIKGGTIPAYELGLKRFYNYFVDIKQITDENKLIKSITQIDMDNFKNWMINKPYAINTINVTITAIKQLTKYLLERKVIKEDFAERIKPIDTSNQDESLLPIKKKDNIEPIFNDLLKMCLTRETNRFFEYNSIRNTFIVLFMASTGARVSEVTNMRFSQINYRNNIPFVIYTEKDTKNRKKKQIPICGKCKEYFDKYIKLRNNLGKINDEDYVILSPYGNKIHREDVNRFLKSYEKRINELKSTSIHITSHTFRHLFTGVAEVKCKQPIVLINEIGGWSNKGLMQFHYAKTIINDESKIQCCESVLNNLIDERKLKGLNF